MMKNCPTILLFCAMTLAVKGETVIRINGTRTKSEGQLLSLIGDRLTHVRAKPASPSRADDAAFLLREVMQKDGYADVQVAWKIQSVGEIRLTVKEGGRLQLGEVTVNEGSDALDQKLAKLYRAPAEKGRAFGSGPAAFREEDVNKGLSFIRQELNASGYWNAQVEVVRREIDQESGDVDFNIKVQRGRELRIAPIKVTSPDGRGVKRTAISAQPFIGKVAGTGNLNAMRLAVEQAFAGLGYPNATITMGRSLTDSSFVPEFTIVLGKRVRLRQVAITGLEATNPKRIRRRVEKLEGEWYDEAAMNRIMRSFLASGAFSSARVETEEVGEKRVDATLHFEEARAKEIRFSLGAGSYQGPIARVGYTDRNLFGELVGFSSGLEVSARGILGEVKLTDPWLFGTDVLGTARLYAVSNSREGYDTFDAGLEGMVTWKFGEHYSMDLLAGYSFVNTVGNGLDGEDLGETVYGNPKLRWKQTWDYRDSKVLPKKGWHLSAPLELGAAIGDQATQYTSLGLEGGWFHEINSKLRLGIGGEFGILIPSGDSMDLPIDLRLFNGGARSVRSYPERELGPLSQSGYATGGEGMWNTNVELIRNLTSSVAAVAFFDAGALSSTFDTLGSADIELAVGLGMRLELPIGPVRFEYGYNLTKDEGEPTGAFHFAIGLAY
jgi:outer membrane protein assembly factor BamA